jgi:hypothetical protein
MQAGDWRVFGLITNRSETVMIHPRLAITVVDNHGNVLASDNVPIIFEQLAPGETSPFRAEFPGIGVASNVQAELSTTQTGSLQRAALEVEITSAVRTTRGGIAILGSITNPDITPASIAAFAVLAQDNNDRTLGIALPSALPGRILGGETAPFLAILEIDSGAFSYEAYIDAVAAVTLLDPQPITLDGSPRLKLDSQNHPIAIGNIKNDSDESYMASIMLTISYQDAWVTVSQIDTPIPLAPGESRAFTATEFPGLSAKLPEGSWSLQDLVLVARIDPLGVGSEVSQASPLDLEILSYEPLGAFAFIRGTVTNPYANHVRNASIMTNLRYSWGEVVTAAWVVAADSLAPGESADFVLPVPIPAESDPRNTEFDTWAAGVQIESDPN